jgi:hypothetical protein
MTNQAPPNALFGPLTIRHKTPGPNPPPQPPRAPAAAFIPQRHPRGPPRARLGAERRRGGCGSRRAATPEEAAGAARPGRPCRARPLPGAPDCARRRPGHWNFLPVLRAKGEPTQRALASAGAVHAAHTHVPRTRAPRPRRRRRCGGCGCRFYTTSAAGRSPWGCSAIVSSPCLCCCGAAPGRGRGAGARRPALPRAGGADGRALGFRAPPSYRRPSNLTLPLPWPPAAGCGWTPRGWRPTRCRSGWPTPLRLPPPPGLSG